MPTFEQVSAFEQVYNSLLNGFLMQRCFNQLIMNTDQQLGKKPYYNPDWVGHVSLCPVLSGWVKLNLNLKDLGGLAACDKITGVPGPT